MKARRIESRILGDFIPKDAENPNKNVSDEHQDIGNRIVEFMQRACESNKQRNSA